MRKNLSLNPSALFSNSNIAFDREKAEREATRSLMASNQRRKAAAQNMFLSQTGFQQAIQLEIFLRWFLFEHVMELSEQVSFNILSG